MSCCLDDVWNSGFSPEKKPEIKLALKQFISQKDSDFLKFFLHIYANQEVNDFIKEKIDEWDFAMALTEINKEHFRFGGDFEIFLMGTIYKMQIIVLKNDVKALILGTDTDKLYPFLEFGNPSTRVHPSSCTSFPTIVQ